MPNSANFTAMSAATRQGVCGNAAKGLSGAGTTQATATPLAADHSEFSTVAASQGAVLAAPNVGEWVSIRNGGANALSVYPNVGAKINGGSVNAAVSLPAGKAGIFIPLDALTWIAVISA